MKLKAILLIIAMTSIGRHDSQAQYNERAVDSVCTVYALLHDFDGVILVSDKNKPIFEGAFGLANRETNAPVKLNTQFCVTQLTNLFTAVMVLKLIEDGDLYFDETLDAFFPKEKIPGKKFITIENLLTYTSGLPNDLQMMENLTAQNHPQEYIGKLQQQKLEAPPGEEHSTKNIDYILLGLIVERIMGKPWDEALKELILDPCGMTETGLLTSAERTPAMAASYHHTDRPVEAEPDIPVRLDNYFAAGAVYSTIGDMFKFDRALFDYKIISRNMTKMMLTQHPDFKNVGLGWTVSQEKMGKQKQTIAQRSGKIQGYNAMWMRFEEDGRSIILLSNSNMADLQDFAEQIRKELYARALADKKNKGKKTNS